MTTIVRCFNVDDNDANDCAAVPKVQVVMNISLLVCLYARVCSDVSHTTRDNLLKRAYRRDPTKSIYNELLDYCVSNYTRRRYHLY